MTIHTLPRSLLLLLGTLVLAPSALAQDETSDDGVAQEDEGGDESKDESEDESEDDEDAPPPSDDDLDEILGAGSENTNRAQDARDLSEGRIDDTKVGVRSDQLVLPAEDAKRKRLIKTLQKKNFMKLGRFEGNIHGAFVANDPFLNRYVVGAALGYNITEIFEIEGTFDFSPDLGEGDYKPLTSQLVNENSVSPDISKMTYFGSGTFLFSPIYGKAAILGKNIINFDMYGAFGMGAARTVDDLEALQADTDDPKSTATQFQVHPTTNFGGGIRVIFNENLAFRMEGRSVVYIETVQSVTLEMKQNFILQGGVSLFFPRMK